MSQRPPIRIVPATRADAGLILTFIRELADYEKRLHLVSATTQQLEATLFCDRPAAEVLIASLADEPMGFALFFQNYSTFLAQPGIYLEDLYVRPQARGSGVGRALLSRLARIARERDCGRVEWAVLEWNQPAIDFYKKLGATAMSDWRIFRLSGEALSRLAGQCGPDEGVGAAGRPD
jgi:GNAT superfamily N-acetyltransferase